MKDRDYQIPTIYPIELDQNRPNVGFGLPDEVLEHSIYANSNYELMRFLNFGAIGSVIDAETNQPYRLFHRNIAGNDLKRLLGEAKKVLNETTEAVKNVLGSIAEKQLTDGNYWRYLIDFPDAEAVGLEWAELKILAEIGRRHGPHAAIAHREKRAIVRVKASTLDQLNKLFDTARTELI